MKVDASQLTALTIDLQRAGELAPELVKPVVAKGALQIKNEWRRRWTGLPHVPALPFAISYDVHQTRTTAWAEIGPVHDRRQAPLATFLEYGRPGQAPMPGGAPALDAETPKFVRALEVAAVKALDAL
jgi:hypothetical protein